MKDRMARAMIEGAERDGLLSPGDTVVEYTGGSTGPALALVCRAKGYRALIGSRTPTSFPTTATGSAPRSGTRPAAA